MISLLIELMISLLIELEVMMFLPARTWYLPIELMKTKHWVDFNWFAQGKLKYCNFIHFNLMRFKTNSNQSKLSFSQDHSRTPILIQKNTLLSLTPNVTICDYIFFPHINFWKNFPFSKFIQKIKFPKLQNKAYTRINIVLKIDIYCTLKLIFSPYKWRNKRFTLHCFRPKGRMGYIDVCFVF